MVLPCAAMSPATSSIRVLRPRAAVTAAVLMTLLACLLMAALVSAGPAAAKVTARTKTETSSLGKVKATFFYRKKSDVDYSDLTLSIERNGALLFKATKPFKGFWPGGFFRESSMRVVDFEGDGEPEVLLNLYSGGAHCCTSSYIYRYRAATNSYKPVIRDFGDVGFKLKNLDKTGPSEFQSVDPAFSGAFTSYAESRFPVQILRFANGRFTDVTASFPALVRRDLRAQKSALTRFRRHKYNARGALAAVAADQYRLGAKTAGDATLARGKELYGATYVKGVRKLLKRGGYIS
jgi:hypothetical protein